MECCGLDLVVWDSVKNGLQESLDIDNNKYTLDHIKSALYNEDMQLWCIHNGEILAVFVTQIINYPNARALDCIGLYGNSPNDWIDVLLETMRCYAEENKCDFMETGGRMGWKKMFEKSGWTCQNIKVSKRINYAK